MIRGIGAGLPVLKELPHERHGCEDYIHVAASGGRKRIVEPREAAPQRDNRGPALHILRFLRLLPHGGERQEMDRLLRPRFYALGYRKGSVVQLPCIVCLNESQPASQLIDFIQDQAPMRGLKGDDIKAIEFGFGSGASILYLANLGWTTVGIDIVEKARTSSTLFYILSFDGARPGGHSVMRCRRGPANHRINSE